MFSKNIPDPFFVGETNSFKIYFHYSPFGVTHLHDVFDIKHPQYQKSFFITSLEYPLKNTEYPIYQYNFEKGKNALIGKKNYDQFRRGFVHARNVIQDHFSSKDSLDIVVFDHGYDIPPFPGGEVTFLSLKNNEYQLNTDIIPLKRSFYFGGCSGDFDNDGIAELFIFDCGANPDFFFKLENNQLNSITHKLPEIVSHRKFVPLAGDTIHDHQGNKHLALASMGDHIYYPADVILINQGDGTFQQDALFLPNRRCGANWACVQLQEFKFHDEDSLIMANYHSADVQHGSLDFYRQHNNLSFSYYRSNQIYEERDSWFFRVLGFNFEQKNDHPDCLFLLKSRGLKKHVQKDFNFTLLLKHKDYFEDVTHELSLLKDKEFIGISTIKNTQNDLDDLLFFDSHGNYYHCIRK